MTTMDRNKKTKGCENLINEGLKLKSKTQAIINEHDPNKLYGMHEASSSFDIVVEYHKWLTNIKQFLELNLKDKIEASVFKGVDSIPTFDWLDEHHHYNGDYIPLGLAQNILDETKDKIDRLIEISRRDSNVSPNKGLWIIKKDGRYYFKDKLVSIRSKRGHYVKIFDSVLSLIPSGGVVSYSDIIVMCKQRGLKFITRKKIQRALCGESAIFFEHIKEIDSIPSLGIPLFESSLEGDKLTFNNKRK